MVKVREILWSGLVVKDITLISHAYSSVFVAGIQLQMGLHTNHLLHFPLIDKVLHSLKELWCIRT